MHLVINSFGTSIKVENGLFLVENTDGKQQFNPQEIKTISISKSARISSDAVLLAIQHEVDVLFINSQGMPLGRVWSVKYGSISTIRQKQLEFLYSPNSFDWVKKLVVRKIDQQIALLLSYQIDDVSLVLKNKIKAACNSMEDHKQKIKLTTADFIQDVAPAIRGWEGASSKRYFQVWDELLEHSFYKFDKRSMNPALNEVNACLNYGYGMLYSKIEGALIKAGIDPYVGIFHRDDYNRPALVYDVIEVFRVWIDYVILQLFRNQSFSSECFVYQGDMCLVDGFGKRVLIQSVNDYLSEIIMMDNKERSRETHIDLYCQKLAQTFLKS